jgi:hypothetical protein
MPYSNFDDTRLFKVLYHQSQQEDDDIDLPEFIWNKLLVIGDLFENEDEPASHPVKHREQIPLQVQTVQSGSLFCNKAIVVTEEKKKQPSKPTCNFRDNKFSTDFSAFIFHPPACIA